MFGTGVAATFESHPSPVKKLKDGSRAAR